MQKKPTINVLFLNSSPALRDILWTKEAYERANRYGFRVRLPDSKNANEREWSSLLVDCDAAITSWGSPRVDERMLQGAGRLRIVGHAAGSVCSVISQEVYQRAITVTTANPVMAHTVAEWSLLMTLMATRNLRAYAQLHDLSPMRWDNREQVRDIRNLTIGIWGFGDISTRLLKMLVPLNPGRILVHSGHTSAEKTRALGAFPATLEELLAESDIVHLLAGMTNENCHRISQKELALLRDGATLINGGRARLVQPEALLRELQSGRIQAILDVFYEEPLPAGDVFRTLPNVLLTPHNAGMPGRELYVPFILDEIWRFFAGEPLHSEVSLERYRTMTDESVARG